MRSRRGSKLDGACRGCGGDASQVGAGVGLGLIVGGPANTGPASPIMTTISEQRVPTRMPERTANYVCSTIPGSGITSPRRAAASRARPSASTAAGTGRRSQISPTAASARST